MAKNKFTHIKIPLKELRDEGKDLEGIRLPIMVKQNFGCVNCEWKDKEWMCPHYPTGKKADFDGLYGHRLGTAICRERTNYLKGFSPKKVCKYIDWLASYHLAKAIILNEDYYKELTKLIAMEDKAREKYYDKLKTVDKWKDKELVNLRKRFKEIRRDAGYKKKDWLDISDRVMAHIEKTKDREHVKKLDITMDNKLSISSINAVIRGETVVDGEVVE